MELRSKAKQMQKKLAEVTETVEKEGIKVRVRADQKVDYIEVDGEERKDIANAINDAFASVQKKAAKKMMEEEGLSGLLGGMQ